MRSKRFLVAVILCALAAVSSVASALTQSQRILLLGSGGGPSPLVASWDAGTSPTFPSAILSYSGASLSTMFDSTGKLTYAPNNLLLNTATLGTQTVTVQSGVSYILSVKGTGSVTLTGASTAGPLNGTGASNRVDLKITAATSSLTLTVSGSVTSARLSAVTYETAFRSQDDVDNTASAYYGPRIDWSDGTPALLIERTKTNYFTNSENAAAWSALNNVTGVSAANSIYGGLALSTLTVSVGGGPAVGQGPYVSVVSGNIYTFTVALVAGTRTTGSIGVYGNSSTWGLDANATATVLSGPGSVARNTGALWDVSGLTSTPTLIKLTRTSAATEIFAPYVYVYTSGAVVGQTLKVGRPQFEAGSVQTSYIPCGASSTTRAPDTLGLAGAALTAGQGAQGTIIAEFAGLNPDSASYQMGFIGSNANGLAYQNLSDTTLYSYNGTSALSYSNFDAVKPAARVAFAWTSSTRALASAGVLVKDTASPWSSAPSNIYLGHLAAGNQVDARLKSFAIYNQRLSDATLQAKSVVGASYAANDNGVRFANNDNLPVHWRIAL